MRKYVPGRVQCFKPHCWSMRFPYNAPGYDMRYVDADGGGVAFDVHRCPSADYFRAQGLGNLCRVSWCNLDYPLADRWDVTLARSQTLAGGAAYCDFRFGAGSVD